MSLSAIAVASDAVVQRDCAEPDRLYHSVSIHEPAANLDFCNRFLLKYASRDEVELLGRGNGGIVEIRNNIAQYLEKSPLYGFLRYRRRNVIIKYLPEDCSRLIQGAPPTLLARSYL
jgi:hypothetical protein